jgi:hypothetical protein
MSPNQHETQANGEFDSEEATQENTPRRPSPPRPQLGQPSKQVSNSIPTSSKPASTSPAQECLRIPGHSTVVSWLDRDWQEHVLDHDAASVFIQYDAQPKSTAFFRLRIKIGQTSRRTPKHVYLFIPPEHIQTLSLRDDSALSLGSKTKAALRRAVGTAGVVSLSFEMRKPCLLVGPKDLYSSPQTNENQS